MKRSKIVLAAIAIAVVVVIGSCNVFDDDFGAVPGGFIYASLTDISGVTSSSTTVAIAFDLDNNLGNGADYVHSLPTPGYESIDQNGDKILVFSGTWSAPEVPVGDYYLYVWIDLNGDGILQFGGDEEFTLNIFHANSDYDLNPVTHVIENTNVGEPLQPVYSVTAGYAPQLDMHNEFTFGG